MAEVANFEDCEKSLCGCRCGKNPPVYRSKSLNFSMGFNVSYAWQPPPQGWIKLNVDDSCLGNIGPASAGGVLGCVIFLVIGFGLNIGETFILDIEVIGILVGFKLVWSMGFRRAIV